VAEQTIDLTFLGEQMKSLQTHTRGINAEMTLIREKIVQVEAEQVEMRDNLFQATGELTVRMGKIENRVAGLELQVGGLSRRIDQQQESLTTNTQVLLSAFKGLDQKFDLLAAKLA
jgi:predicted  nucleic acid-binding Zn-ribbon protein